MNELTRDFHESQEPHEPLRLRCHCCGESIVDKTFAIARTAHKVNDPVDTVLVIKPEHLFRLKVMRYAIVELEPDQE
jgi:hypothetical protein